MGMHGDSAFIKYLFTTNRENLAPCILVGHTDRINADL